MDARSSFRISLRHRHPAVDGKRLPRDTAARRGCEEQDGANAVLRPSIVAQRNAFNQLLVIVSWRKLRVEPGSNETRSYRVDRNSPRSEFLGPIARNVLSAPLAAA